MALNRLRGLVADVLGEAAWVPRRGLNIEGQVHPPAAALLALRDHVYSVHFCRWSPPESETPVHGDPAFVARLCAATDGARYWSDGWDVQKAGDGYAFVSDGTLTLFVDDPATLSPWPASPGSAVRVLVPCARQNLAPGFFYLVGTHGRFDRKPPTLRLYLNLRPAGAKGLVTELLARFDRLGVAFEAKLVNDPAAYGRLDTGVVYVARDDFATAVGAVREVAAAHPRWWREGSPPFTLPLGRGLAAAECPPDSAESFGHHRCRLFASGVLAAVRVGETSPELVLDRVAAAFAAEGIDLARPYGDVDQVLTSL